MIYLPDTNAWIEFLNPGESSVKKRISATKVSQLRLCSVVKAELYYGAEKSSRRSENLKTLNELFSGFSSFTFDDEAACKYGVIRAQLAKAGTPIGPNDLMIAAIARVHNLVLVTHNIKEFSRVENLQIEDWQNTPN